jgi:hypothetical protein
MPIFYGEILWRFLWNFPVGVDLCTLRARIGVFRATATTDCVSGPSVSAEGSASARIFFEYGYIVAPF